LKAPGVTNFIGIAAEMVSPFLQRKRGPKVGKPQKNRPHGDRENKKKRYPKPQKAPNPNDPYSGWLKFLDPELLFHLIEICPPLQDNKKIEPVTYASAKDLSLYKRMRQLCDCHPHGISQYAIVFDAPCPLEVYRDSKAAFEAFVNSKLGLSVWRDGPVWIESKNKLISLGWKVTETVALPWTETIAKQTGVPVPWLKSLWPAISYENIVKRHDLTAALGCFMRFLHRLEVKSTVSTEELSSILRKDSTSLSNSLAMKFLKRLKGETERQEGPEIPDVAK